MFKRFTQPSKGRAKLDGTTAFPVDQGKLSTLAPPEQGIGLASGGQLTREQAEFGAKGRPAIVA